MGQSPSKGKIIEIEISFSIRRGKIKYKISKDKICKQKKIIKENKHLEIHTECYKKITDKARRKVFVISQNVHDMISLVSKY